MSTILDELETAISGLKVDSSRSNVGSVREVDDGVAKLEGLSDVMLNEMLEFPGGLYGLALNLEEDEVGAILLGDSEEIKEGTEVRTTGGLLCFSFKSEGGRGRSIFAGYFERIKGSSGGRNTGRLLSVPVGKGLLGR